jgi:hypothetical protein
MDSESLKILWVGTALASGVGVVITLIAAASGIPKWSVVVLVIFGSLCFVCTGIGIGWIKFPLSIHSARSDLIIGAILIGMIALGILVWPKPEKAKIEEFSISEPRSMVNMKRNLRATLPIWVRYGSGYGDTISPVAVALLLDITSNSPRPERIKSYSVAIKTMQCGWMYLSPIRMNSVRAYYVFPQGINHAALLDFSSNGLEFTFGRDIPAFGTVSGWLLFDSRAKCETALGEQIQFRVKLETFSGIKFEKVIDGGPITNIAPIPGTSQANMTGMTFVIPPPATPENLSTSYRKFYSDEAQ